MVQRLPAHFQLVHNKIKKLWLLSLRKYYILHFQQQVVSNKQQTDRSVRSCMIRQFKGRETPLEEIEALETIVIVSEHSVDVAQCLLAQVGLVI